MFIRVIIVFVESKKIVNNTVAREGRDLWRYHILEINDQSLVGMIMDAFTSQSLASFIQNFDRTIKFSF